MFQSVVGRGRSTWWCSDCSMSLILGTPRVVGQLEGNHGDVCSWCESRPVMSIGALARPRCVLSSHLSWTLSTPFGGTSGRISRRHTEARLRRKTRLAQIQQTRPTSCEIARLVAYGKSRTFVPHKRFRTTSKPVSLSASPTFR